MRQLGQVKCLDVYNNENAPWVIMFHGYGANAQDLFPLAEYLSTKTELNWLFPDGIFEVPIGPGWTGKGWWPISLDRLTEDITHEIPTQLPTARKKTLEMISALKVPWNKLIFAGFSQGGMLAVDLCLQAPENPMGLVVMSSSLINKKEWQEKVSARKGLPFIQSHGEQDAVLPFKGAQKLYQFLKENGLAGEFVKFSGGHEIPPPALMKISQFLDKVSSPTLSRQYE